VDASDRSKRRNKFMDALTAIVQVSVLVFVISSMLAMGFSLTMKAIIAPLKNLRLVLIALAVSFIAVPAVAWGIQQVMNLDTDIYRQRSSTCQSYFHCC
jgi:BASS family bile acid:Na+ symporter